MKIGAAFYRNKSRNHFMGIFLTPRPFRDGFCILVLAAIGKIGFIRDSVLRLSWTENPLVSSYSPCDLYLNTNQLPVHVLPPASPFPFSPLNPPIYSLSQASNVRVNLKRKLSRFQRITFTFSQSRSKLDMGEMHQREKEIDRCACAFEQVDTSRLPEPWIAPSSWQLPSGKNLPRHKIPAFYEDWYNGILISRE
ncbi:hypothetical protein PCH_Pc21g04380 [Penicillium rubens Wisconsin 54-1255]|uniref:Uncharacterized protein n=1 Tax=Penicillium rubens (strain ATCC 28089 / DSM 1075 / NRRL 1951 / Wisconsin 54-1255) TaxID=500485 RepID=B6HMB1_PENRW|nr:hypothetical protein PCH_Pc21g04380 [Penicillium rubens Wisconsin 54-1255]